ncbi:MAG: inositol monophosphatase [Candidatus Liptonbacteria bacterium RIFCSPLOWO2_01_FULL_53_13]|uniref:Probable inosine/xanthosine triphosphatase n=1 Tax=Candidatus Liptonbacteria bacterium RIFCSPLOWO2_01_FULL_53_13 TaxID=1798651 RepID=A0A1G2CL90_9BACT|nr:MAG: inositol monophosphatase [Candidatus Liptonbacteria bacterium RIFCSPLOWO2_01_FULL_53_13]
MKKIIVASTNPVKINAVTDGFIRMFPEEQFEVEGKTVPSGVGAQPMSSDEALQGATNRAEHASKEIPHADYWVGSEAGVEDIDGEMRAFAWIAVKSKEGISGKGRTGTFILPPKVRELILQGKELGEADDIVFGRTNSKQENGAVGLLTHDLITRTSFYAEAVILALIPFKNRKLY